MKVDVTDKRSENPDLESDDEPGVTAAAVESADEKADKTPVAPTEQDPVDAPAVVDPASKRGPRSRTTIGFVAAGVLAVVLFALAAFQYWGSGADDRDVEKNQSAAASFASDSAIKILSYKHGTVDQDVATATRLLSGDFLDYYKNFTGTVVIPAAKKEQVDTQATIAGTAVERASSDGATVLVFVNQSTTTASNDTPTLSASSVRVVLKRVDGQLRVDKFDPV